ncbi:hypothetical protein M8998_09150 [Sphingobacterium sp. lm-10]|uniref:hypothetical protein n=1 Tax=Sphingobacterium sp. lm-10 TaxID=2944904 RepID=UPI0020224AB5|nr:hypothetical protein [Sphingobacterium sp. lm-10]MCL7988100.1 hypothetical protein [Sphingobacterium sp. lm-10]
MSVLLFAQSISVLGVYAGFYANRDYISQNLCTYRNVKNSACGGECILMKKLKQAQEQQDEALNHLMQVSTYILPPFDFYLPTPEHIDQPQDEVSLWSPSQYAFSFHSRLFRPPLA